MQRRCQLGFVLGVLLALSSTAWGQTVNGAITGVVKDSSGGVVPDVALTLRNIATDQIVGTTVSGPEGEYAFRNLRAFEIRSAGDQGRVPAGRRSRHRGHSRLDAARRSHAAGRRAGAARRGDRRVIGARHDPDAGARHLARDAAAAAAADEQRPACGGGLRHADAGRQHRRRQRMRSTPASTAACSRATRPRSTASACSRAS